MRDENICFALAVLDSTQILTWNSSPNFEDSIERYITKNFLYNNNSIKVVTNVNHSIINDIRGFKQMIAKSPRAPVREEYFSLTIWKIAKLYIYILLKCSWNLIL